MEPALTSVVMVSYNTGAVLFRAIDGVLAQSTPVELIIVDNGNPPETLEEIRARAATDSRVRLITGQGNVGFARGCNFGARSAAGDYILLLNPDSLLPPDATATLLAYGATLKRPFMLGARLLDEDGTDQRGCRRALLTPATMFIEAMRLGRFFPHIRFNYNKDPVPTALTTMPAISGAFMFLPKEDFWAIDGYDEGYFLHVEDLDICLRFRRHGGEIYFVPDVVVTHIGGTSDATTAFVERHKARGFIRYFHKNFSNDYPLLFLWVIDLAVWMRTWLKIAINKVR